MSMNEAKLMTEVRTIEGLEHLNSMHTLENGIAFEKWSEVQTKSLLDVLLDCFFNRTFENPYEKNELQRLINLLLMRNDYKLTDTDLKHLLACLKTSHDPLQLNPALHMLSLTYNPEFISILESFTDSTHQALSATATEGIELIRLRPRH